MEVLLLHLDGSLPNLALMRLAAHHRGRGDVVELRRVTRPEHIGRFLWDDHDHVYASLIFERSRPLARRLLETRPDAIIGGTGWDCEITLESIGVRSGRCDYSIYPGERRSIGFTQRGCRLKCSFCVVPRKEGRAASEGTLADIWRGEPWPKDIILLDNDFFGVPEWPDRIEEIRSGGYRVNFNQGINARFLTPETAAAIAAIPYYDTDFRKRRIYTAWDNRRDEARLFAGLGHLKAAGVPPSHVTVYVLVAYDHASRTARPSIHEDDVHRVRRLREWGADPYPMPFVRTPETIGFQRWVLRQVDKQGVTWEQFRAARCDSRNMAPRPRPLFAGLDSDIMNRADGVR
jgi:hypothetical protein